MRGLSPFRSMNTLFAGLAASLAYGVLGALIVLLWSGQSEAQAFLLAYTTSFKALVSLGLILGTALIVFRSQDVIPRTIEAAFTTEQLAATDYEFHRRRFATRRRSATFAAQFVVAAFVVFTLCQFPLSQPGEAVMVIAACAQYACGVYVGRKLFYAGMMLHSLLTVPLDRNLFKERELDDINTYVNVVSTLTVVFVYIHVIGYYEGPFTFQSIVGPSVKPLLLLPAVIATPVLLIFNFYPRAVLRKLYSQSIDIEVKELRQLLSNEALSSFEKRSHLIEFDKMSREELRYNLQLTLGDLPIGITILIMVLEPLIRR